jgi:hypothetical protein
LKKNKIFFPLSFTYSKQTKKERIMITEIFYHADEFCKSFEKEIGKKLLSCGKNKRKRETALSLSEVVTIVIYFHFSGYKNFKNYYKKHVCIELKQCFGKFVSYNRFIELQQKSAIAIMIFANLINKAKCTKISFIDSFHLPVCHIKRSYANKVFHKIAAKGKTSIGWFFGFKVHVIINHLGEIISFAVTPGNVPDGSFKVVDLLTKDVQGLLIGDKGYLGEQLFKNLWQKGIKMVTKIRKNMKNKPMILMEKLLLKKRGVIESVGNILKNILQISNTRHRSPTGLFVALCSGLISYALRSNKPHIKLPSNLLIEQNA